MSQINLKLKMDKSYGEVVVTLNFDDKKELTKYVVKREKRLDEWL